VSDESANQQTPRPGRTLWEELWGRDYFNVFFEAVEGANLPEDGAAARDLAREMRSKLLSPQPTN
jgi:hypothetical protein